MFMDVNIEEFLDKELAEKNLRAGEMGGSDSEPLGPYALRDDHGLLWGIWPFGDNSHDTMHDERLLTANADHIITGGPLFFRNTKSRIVGTVPLPTGRPASSWKSQCAMLARGEIFDDALTERARNARGQWANENPDCPSMREMQGLLSSVIQGEVEMSNGAFEFWDEAQSLATRAFWSDDLCAWVHESYAYYAGHTFGLARECLCGCTCRFNEQAVLDGCIASLDETDWIVLSHISEQKEVASFLDRCHFVGVKAMLLRRLLDVVSLNSSDIDFFHDKTAETYDLLLNHE